jgi:hypothetical protein
MEHGKDQEEYQNIRVRLFRVFRCEKYVLNIVFMDLMTVRNLTGVISIFSDDVNFVLILFKDI